MSIDQKNTPLNPARGSDLTAPVSAETGVEAIYRAALRGFTDQGVVEPMPAVAAILWRKGQSGGIEVYLVQRSPTMSFAPGMWSFPGGGVSPKDHKVDVVGTQGDEAARIAALVRELGEETGLELELAAKHFSYACKLTTPEFSPIRFDVWFYLVEVTGEVRLDVTNSGELIEASWACPGHALEKWRRCHWIIAPPVRLVLHALEAEGELSDRLGDGVIDRLQEYASIANTWPRLYEIVPGIFNAPLRTPTLPPARHTNCYLIGGRQLVVIDPASPYDDERAALDHAIAFAEGQGRRVVEIWLTHHHIDHVSGAAYLRERLGVPVAAHPRTAELVAGRVTVDRSLADGETCDLAGEPSRRLRVIYTPGHAPGHICILEENTRFVVAGDMVAGVGTILIEPTEGDMALYLDSLERLKALRPAGLLPAHGPDIVTPSAARGKLEEYIEHRLWREQRVLAALEQLGEATSRALVPIAYSDVPPAIHGLAERSLIAHLVKLARERRAERQGELWRAAG